jgi:hypothetical protein
MSGVLGLRIMTCCLLFGVGGAGRSILGSGRRWLGHQGNRDGEGVSLDENRTGYINFDDFYEEWTKHKGEDSLPE